MSLGERIKKLREIKGMTQGELGEIVGVNRSQISNIEKGKRSTTVERQVKIAKALGISVADLYDEEDKLPEEDGYLILTEELKKEGIDPQTARAWLEFARKFVDESKKND